MIKTEKKAEIDNTPMELMVSRRKAYEMIAGVFTLVIIALFPLVFYDYYYDILRVKYIFYYGTVILMAVVTIITAIIYRWKGGRNLEGQNTKRIIERLNVKAIRTCDWAMIAFVAVVIVSTLQSDYLYESFWGNEGRFMGLFLTLMYGVSYYIISRYLKFKQWYLDVFLGAGMIACMIGLLQYFKIDPIGFKDGISSVEYPLFTSTIGNINTYTSYVALIAGVGCVLFTVEKNIYRRIWYLFTIIVSLFALITGISDNAYLTMMAIFGLLPLYLFNNLKGIKKYSLLLAILFTEFLYIDLINRAFPDQVLGISGLFNVIAGYKYLDYIVVLLWGITIALYILDYCRAKKDIPYKDSNMGRWIWLGIIIAVFLGGCYILYDVNIAGNAERYGSLKQYLVINDDWGTHRWYIWRIGMESYQEFPLLHKIFGHGPDTFGIITVNNYYDEMIARYGEKFDSAHNEYLQYLFTIGIAGLVAYLGLLFTSIVHMIRNSRKTPALMAIVFALLCYGTQAAVNISVPIVAPIMMTLLMVGVSVGKLPVGEYGKKVPDDTVAPK